MKLRILITGAVALVALGLLAVACGGDDDGGGDQTAIRTTKGLSVAALGGNLGVGGDSSASADSESTGASIGGAAAPAASRIGAGGDMAAGLAPALQEGGNGITVQGYGSATADPDSAVAEFYFGTNVSYPKPEPLPFPSDGSSSSGSSGNSGVGTTRDEDIAPSIGAGEPITEADLQPVIDAIASQGIGPDDIEFIPGYADPYSSSATLRATVNNLDSLDGVVQAAADAASNLGDIGLQGTNVSYTVNDCGPLETAAMKAAVEDAGDRAAAFADALGVGLGAITGASNYSYSPYGGSPCDGGYAGPYPMGGIAYSKGQPGAVQVFANVSVTYAIQ